MFRYEILSPINKSLEHELRQQVTYLKQCATKTLVATPNALNVFFDKHNLAYAKIETPLWLTQYTLPKSDIDISMILGPCGFESRDMTLEVAAFLHDNNLKTLRGGCFKPRTSPYSFQGYGYQALPWLVDAKERYGLHVVSEITDIQQLQATQHVFDVIQIGSRNMSSFALIQAAAQQQKPIILKRGFSATYKEWLLAAEYALLYGATEVILCERGIRSFEPSTRFTFDICAIPSIQEQSSLRIIADPSHACGHKHLIPSVSRAALAAGADGLMIEMHPNPKAALSDADQALNPKEMQYLLNTLKPGVTHD
ncbi:MAG: 3-deoxy-7-phosphoheptulonate synthase [Candidatus Comchoanobacterales bacterium]